MTRERGTIGRWAKRIAVFGAGLLIPLALAEGIVFRSLLPASDLPRLEWPDDDVLRYAPDQTGVFRLRDEIEARYRINAQGWSSGHPTYRRERTEGRRRVVVVGDSLVEALMVDADRSMAENLEQRLGPDVEVFRFGLSGAHLAQYLHVLRAVLPRFRPDVAVVVLSHNDFDQSLRAIPGVYTRSLMRLRVQDGSVEEIAPEPYVAPWYTLVRRSATWRYLSMRRGIGFHGLRRQLLGTAQHQVPGFDDPDVAAATDYVLDQMAGLARRHGAGLQLVINGDLRAIEGRHPSPQHFGLVDRVGTMAERHGIPVLDLHPVFERELEDRAAALCFPSNPHWNEAGHDAVARAIHAEWRSRGSWPPVPGAGGG